MIEKRVYEEEMPSEHKVTTVLDEETKKALEDRAREESRSLSNLVSIIVKREVQTWLPKKDTPAERFLKQVAKEGKRPNRKELAELSKSLEVEESKLIEMCDRLFQS
ncbi:MAG: hypothetical protein SAL07_19650 [Oscillatoria sp. PMC 1051.18]|nr:hypothetical protein [Oscillatoria sp. PMC 1050.18]MEC5032118.1 hypothetical protein [Oscillatoria sp. PMC 1051.18]